MNHAIWLTTAKRNLRLYISTAHLDEHLMKLAKFVMKTYNPMWFEIKVNPYVTSGARYNFKAVSMVKQQSDGVKKLVFPVLQRNTYLTLKIFLLLCLQIKILKSKNWHAGELRKVVQKIMRIQDSIAYFRVQRQPQH